MYGNHATDDAFVKSRLDDFKCINPNVAPNEANKFLQESLIPELKNKIMLTEQSNFNLNEYFKTIVNPGLVPNY